VARNLTFTRRSDLSEATTQRYRVYENVGPPPLNSGPRSPWSDLPLDTIEIGDLVEVPLEAKDVRIKINAIRSYAGRLAKKNDKKFSVRITNYGIGIWRTA
tara:strand:+ start:599 stop:901 length:303 start_codon:yes stop_codon:yes gene_type:complete